MSPTILYHVFTTLAISSHIPRQMISLGARAKYCSFSSVLWNLSHCLNVRNVPFLIQFCSGVSCLAAQCRVTFTSDIWQRQLYFRLLLVTNNGNTWQIETDFRFPLLSTLLTLVSTLTIITFVNISGENLFCSSSHMRARGGRGDTGYYMLIISSLSWKQTICREIRLQYYCLQASPGDTGDRQTDQLPPLQTANLSINCIGIYTFHSLRFRCPIHQTC